MKFDLTARPNVVPWPPLLYALAVVVALVVDHAWPLRFGLPTVVREGAWVLLVAGLSLDLSAIFTMARARTNIMPHRAAGRLVDWGPFAYSRNPIYTGNTLALIGLSLALDRVWLLAAAFAAAALTQTLAIRREEAHCEARFGEAWRDYAAHVPRWFGLGPMKL